MAACVFDVCFNICVGMGCGGEEHPSAGKALPRVVKTHKALFPNTVEHMADPFVAFFQKRQGHSLLVTSIF